MSGWTADLAFLGAGALCLASAAVVVTRRNPVYAVLGMLPYILGLTALLALLSAPFLAAMQVMVYGGAILVVFLFVLMLINLRPEELRDDFRPANYVLPALSAGLLGGLLAACVLKGIPAEMERAFAEAAPGFGAIGDLSAPLLGRYLAPFELVSLVIVTAVAGAVLLAKRRL